MKWGVALLVGFAIIVFGFRYAGWLLNAFFVLNCLVLIVVVLLQSGKAADLAGAFGGAGSQTAFGPRGAATVLSQATTWCAVMFMVCAMALALRADRAVGGSGSAIYNTAKPGGNKPAAKQPAAPPAKPAEQQPANPTPAAPAEKKP